MDTIIDIDNLQKGFVIEIVRQGRIIILDEHGNCVGSSCSKCKGIFITDCFGKNKRKKYGISNICKECKKEKVRKWRENNPEKSRESSRKSVRKWRENNQEKWKEINKKNYKKYIDNNPEYNKEYYKNNKESIKEKVRKYREDNLEKCRESSRKSNRKHYENNKESIKEINRKYRENNPEKCRERHKKYRKDNPEKSRESSKRWRENNQEKWKEINRKYRENNPEKCREYINKRRAKEKGNGGSYTEEQLRDCLEFFDYKCAYSGQPLKEDLSNLEIEHVIPISKGGTSFISNIVTSVMSVNRSKSNKDMLEWYKKQDYFTEERLNKIYEWIEYAKLKYNYK